MIGNDVVDLEMAAKQSNWRRKGFLEKVFLSHEKEIITVSLEPEFTVWLLWSMKEAAYKAHQREFNLPARLNWHILSCKLQEFEENSASGEVDVEGETYFTTSKITLAYIHTSAEKIKKRGAKNVIFETSSSLVKENLIKQVAAIFKVDAAQLRLQKDALGMPFLRGENNFQFNRFSLSGHGKFYVCCLSLINCETAVKHS